jgi:predicted ferric reductase
VSARPNGRSNALSALLAAFSALWLLADTLVPPTVDFFLLRGVFIQYTGVIGIGAMSAAMCLAARPKWLEPRLDGLDKMCRRHKWLGIAGPVLAITHWLWTQGAKWMVGWAGWHARRGGNGHKVCRSDWAILSQPARPGRVAG